MKTGSAKSIQSPREWIFDLNPGCTTPESDCRTTTAHCSCHQLTFGDKHDLWSWAVTGRQTSDVHLQSVSGAGWKNSSPTLSSWPSFPCPPPPSWPLGTFLCFSGQHSCSWRQPLGTTKRLYDVQMVFPPSPSLFMSVASGSWASPDVPDCEKGSPGKTGIRCQRRWPQASSGWEPPVRGLGWMLERRMSLCHLCPALWIRMMYLRSQEYHF